MQSEKSKLTLTVIRLCAVFLVLISVPRASAGLLYYQGQQALKKSDAAYAASKFQNARQYNPFNPYYDYWAGVSFFKQGEKTGDLLFYVEAGERLAAFTRKLSENGKGWAYLALARAALEGHGDEKVQDYFQKARTQDPGNAWISYMAGRSLLLQDPVNQTHRQAAAELIRKALDRHYPGKPSPLIGFVLQDLWTRFADLHLLQEVTPEDVSSYRKLLNFIDLHGLWLGREPVFMKYWELKRREYGERCTAGDRLLKQGQYKKAFSVYEKAWWLEKKYLPARIGISKAQEALGEIRYSSEQLDLSQPQEVFQPERASMLEYPAEKWRGDKNFKGVLQRRGTAKMGLYLEPGEIVIEVSYRGFSKEAERGYAVLYLGTEPVGSLYAEDSTWQTHRFRTSTAGGGQRLTVELINGVPRNGKGRGPLIELGNVRVIPT